MLANTTNTPNFKEFIEVMKKKYNLSGSVLVLDNHASHIG